MAAETRFGLIQSPCEHVRAGGQTSAYGRRKYFVVHCYRHSATVGVTDSRHHSFLVVVLIVSSNFAACLHFREEHARCGENKEHIWLDVQGHGNIRSGFRTKPNGTPNKLHERSPMGLSGATSHSSPESIAPSSHGRTQMLARGGRRGPTWGTQHTLK